MIGLSPKGVINIFIALFMLIIGVALDILGAASVFGGTPLTIIGVLTIGIWILAKTGQDINQQKLHEMADAGKKGGPAQVKSIARGGAKEAGAAAKTQVKAAGKKVFGKIISRVAIMLIELIPVVNAILFGWTAIVVWELIDDFKNFRLGD